MSESRLQNDRFVAEQGQRSGPPLNMISTRYRLAVADLPAGSVETTVRAVTLQGMDTPSLLLHGERLPHPLLLDQENVQALTRLAGSPLFADWIGRRVVLHAVDQGNAHRIVLTAPGAKPRAPQLGRLRAPQPRMGKVKVLALLCFAVVILAALFALQWPSLGLTLPR